MTKEENKLERYLNMLIYQSRLNEDRLIKTGLDADSVADKLESLKQSILQDQEIVQRLKAEIESLIEKRKESFCPSKKRGMLYKREKYLKSILEKNEHRRYEYTRIGYEDKGVKE